MMAMYTPTATLCVRSVQNALRKGWPNKGFKESRGDMQRALETFKREQGRDMLLKEAANFRGL